MTASIPPVLLLGAGRMGSAMFAGWAAAGLAPSMLVDPSMPPCLARPADVLIPSLDAWPDDFTPGAVVLAIKPQVAPAILPALGARLPHGVPVLSILAGLTVMRLDELLGGNAAIVRAMPNTPAAIGQGMTVAFAGPAIAPAQHALCHRLLAASGDIAWIEDEALIDPITSVSGCGPAYVFLLAELLEREGVAQGIPAPLARQLARKTVSGAGALLGRLAGGIGCLAPGGHQSERRYRTRAGRADAGNCLAGCNPGRPSRGSRTVARTGRVNR